jgi:hypothetical protein
MKLHHLGLLLCGALTSTNCVLGDNLEGSQDADQLNGSVAHEWMALTASIVKAEKIAPPLAARIYGYVGLAIHESAQAGRGTSSRSYAKKLNAVGEMPESQSAAYVADVSVAHGTAAVLRALISSDDSKARITALLDAQIVASTGSEAAHTRSAEFGDQVAAVIIARSTVDGFATTRGMTYTLPVGPDKWVPTGAALKPLEPFWGTLLPLSSASTVTDCTTAAGAPKPFSTDPNSEMFKEAKATYDAVKNGIAADEEVTYHWADNPGQTPTPPGHWMEIGMQEGTAANQTLDQAGVMYAQLGIAEMDAFITGWKIKYTYNLMRPETYIKANIDATWKPRLSTPPFPEYVSGHSMGSSAGATVLASIFGEQHAFVDKTRDGVSVSDSGNAPHVCGMRNFTSFNAAAQEAAASRLYGGIHFPMGNAQGLVGGACVGAHVIAAIK